eukprot:2001498-Rhodomonas_salina.1
MTEHQEYTATSEVDAVDFVCAAQTQSLSHPKLQSQTKRAKCPDKGKVSANPTQGAGDGSAERRSTVLPLFPLPLAIPAANNNFLRPMESETWGSATELLHA